MKLLTFLYAILFVVVPGSGELTYQLKEADIRLDMANDAWSLADKQENKGMVVYIFKRQPIEDAEGRQVIPNIAVIIEEVDKDLDAVTYSAMKRSEVNFEVQEVFTHESGKMHFSNAVGYRGQYADSRKLDHTIYVVHGVNGGKGIQLICDATTSVIGTVEEEFFTTLKSLSRR